jgi:biopolymer transport protein ExbB/TolQ
MDFSLLGLWSQMGPVAKTVVIILLLMSMVVIAISLERFFALRKGRERSLAYVRALQPLLTRGGNLTQAADLQKQWPDAPLSRVIGTGLREFGEARGDLGNAADPVEIELLVHGVGRTMDRAKKREIAGLQRGLPFLATVSSSAPFVGLFGTVFGIITAFQQMADPARGGGGGLATVSAGISEALLTTAVGLAVAIVSVWFYNFFTTRIDAFGLLIDDATGELADRLPQLARDPRNRVPAPPSATA